MLLDLYVDYEHFSDKALMYMSSFIFIVNIFHV